MQHPDFYSVATTVALVFLVGGLYVVSQSTHLPIANFYFLCGPFILPGTGVVLASLLVLADIWPDISAVRWMIVLLVTIQLLSGSVGLGVQAMQGRQK
ncbi:membrane protein of unknown function [Modestobacter italicus]|uniref:Uncharacterized protein n=1 Tax=Modestobacter italicus (strain DSM 44449 / CECT 9708 / BC 501) TaxID=2732864 RepID=I4EX73_MODI5|nr:membrane protein of unknown function [Modestobacter marinus]